MILTEELYNIGKDSKEICTIIDDDYVLVTKSMPVVDSKIKFYVNAIKKAKQSGINIASILDYKIIPGTTVNFSNDEYRFSKGVFLEDRAKGNSLGNYNLFFRSNRDNDISQFVISYMKSLDEYTLEIERRAVGPQEHFDKLVKDCLDVRKFGIEIDPKPLNFFYDSNVGYTIIDVIGYNDSSKIVSPYFTGYIFGIVYGYGKPVAMVDGDFFTGIPKEYSDRLRAAYKVLDTKIVRALRKYKIQNDYIQTFLAKRCEQYTHLDEIVEIEDMETMMNNLIKKEKAKPTASFTLSIS